MIVKLGVDEGLPPVAGVAGQDARGVHEEKEAAGAGKRGGTGAMIYSVQDFQLYAD